MEGPTPVSALIHAATMVNAGLYLVARMVPFVDVGAHGVDGLSELGLIVAYIGGITAFMAASIAFVQNDIKKVLAYSTMSQLAYIFTGLGVALWFYNNGKADAATLVFGGAMFHLFNHAMAKGCSSWRAARSYTRCTTPTTTSTRATGTTTTTTSTPRTCGTWGLAAKLPVTSAAMMIGSMSIIGIPLIGGFWSKEAIVAKTWKASLDYEPLMFGPAILVLLTAGMTGFYMSRMWFMTSPGAQARGRRPRPRGHPVDQGATHHTLRDKRPGGFGLAVLSVVKWLAKPYSYDLGLNGDSLASRVVYELEHAFLPDDPNLRIVGGPRYSSPWSSGRSSPPGCTGLPEGGPVLGPLVSWLVWLSGRFGSQDATELSESSLSVALQNRLYFDHYYELALSKTVVPSPHSRPGSTRG